LKTSYGIVRKSVEKKGFLLKEGVQEPFQSHKSCFGQTCRYKTNTLPYTIPTKAAMDKPACTKPIPYYIPFPPKLKFTTIKRAINNGSK